VNKKLISLSIMLSAVAMSSSAFAALDGGQISFAGLVSDNTCKMNVNNGAQDAEIQLLTASVADVNAVGVVKTSSTGAKPKAFSIIVDCSASGTTPAGADLTMTSSFRSNSHGTLSNDMSIDNPAKGVDIAIHEVNMRKGTYAIVYVDGENKHSQSFNSDMKATWNFVASYVAQTDPDQPIVPVSAGFIKSNAAYTLTYN
jgi:P pilus assembly protein, pilin FimA